MNELEIPERAVDAAWDASMGAGNFPLDNALEAAAPIIVAVELRRLAAEFAVKPPLDPIKRLLDRAGELEWPGTPPA